MAVKIPEYQSRLTPNGFQPANASIAPQIDTGGAGMQRAGQMITEMGVKFAQEANQKADQDDWLRAQTALLQMHQDITQYSTDLSQAQEPGAYGFTDKIRENVRSYSTKLLEQGGWRENTKRLLQGKLLDLEGTFVGSAMQFEAKAGVDLRLGQIDKNTAFYQQQLLANPENYETIMGGIDTMIDNAAIGPQLKQKLKADYRRNIAVSTIQAIKEKNPEVAKKLLESVYGAGSPDQFGDLQVDPKSLDQETWGQRPDGSTKSTGWLGVLKRPDGGVSTEISINFDDVNDGKDFPLLVPTLDRKEVDKILAIAVDDPKFMEKVPKSAIDKAIKFAKMRQAEGLSPFAGPSDSPQMKSGGADGEAITTPYNPTAAPVGIVANVGKNTARWTPQVTAAAERAGLNPNILLAQIQQESGGNPNAVNNNDKKVTGSASVGIAQFQPGTAQRYGIDPKDPEQAIQGQAAYMADLMKMFGNDYRKALAGYNWGEGNVQKAIDKHGENWFEHIPSSTKKYINNIMTMAQDTAPVSAAPSVGGETGPTMAPTVGVTVPRDQMELPAWGARIVQDIDVDKIPSLIASAEADINRLRTQFKAEVLTREQNDLTMFADGKSPAVELSMADYQKAFGDEEGAIRFKNYQSVKTLGTDKLAVTTMSNEQQDKLLQKYQPDPNRPEFYAATKERQAVLAQAINEVRTERNKDPISFAMKNNIGGLQKLNFDDVPAFGAEISKRYGVAMEMSRSFGTPFQIMTPGEKDYMLDRYSKLTDQGKIAFLATLNANTLNANVYRSIVQQIAPDSPVTAVVGNLVGISSAATFKTDNWFTKDEVRTYDPKVVALTILQGEQLLNPSKGDKASDGRVSGMKLPKEDDMRLEFADTVGNSFSHQGKEYDVTYQAVKAYYVAKSVAAGNFNQDRVDTKIWNEAVEAVTGGVTEVNGKTQVRRPWGMTETAFIDGAKAAFQAETKRLGLNLNYEEYGLENSGDGYLVRHGSGYKTYKGKDGNLHSIYITIGNTTPKSDSQLPSPTPGASSKVDVNKPTKQSTK